MPKIRARLESALEAMTETEAAGSGASSLRRVTVLGQLADAMQDYLAELEGSVEEDQIVYSLSPEIERRMKVAQDS